MIKRVLEHFETFDRNDIIDLCAVFAAHIGNLFEQNPTEDLVIEVGGHYASGKSLIADAVKAKLTGRPVEKARWKRIETENCHVRGHDASISFINARYDIANIIGNSALRKRPFGGPVFISNRPPIDLGKAFTPIALPASRMKINVWFNEGAKRPRQLGPFKFGPSVEMGPRHIDFIQYETVAV